MKALLAALLIITSSLFGQNINATSDGPIYDRDGRMIAYKYADGTRDLYTYDSQWRMTSFTDRAGNVTHFLSSSQGADNTMSESTTATSAPVDQTLYTRYDIYTGSPFVDYCVCGSTQQSSGCYSCGNLGPFGKVGALIEGNPSTDQSTSTVTRYIYVLDIATGSNQNGVTLYVYKKTDMISPSDDMVTVSLFNTVNLPLVGGSSAFASMAANNKSLFIGTNRSAPAVQVQKKTFAVSVIDGGVSHVSAITANPYGYITVTTGSFGGTPVFYLLNPSGAVIEDGGGPDFMLNTVQATLPSTFP